MQQRSALAHRKPLEVDGVEKDASPASRHPLYWPRRRYSSSNPSRSLRTRSSRDANASLAQLLEVCARGDEEAWERLVGRFGGLVWSVAIEVGLSRDDAADVFQYVWMELHRSLRRIHDAEALPRWLMVATRRQCYKVAAHRRRCGIPIDAQIGPELLDPKRLADEEVLVKEHRRRLEEAMTRLNPKDAELLRLLFLDPDRPSYEEISRRTGLAVGSIGPIRARCLRRLRVLMEESS